MNHTIVHFTGEDSWRGGAREEKKLRKCAANREGDE